MFQLTSCQPRLGTRPGWLGETQAVTITDQLCHCLGPWTRPCWLKKNQAASGTVQVKLNLSHGCYLTCKLGLSHAGLGVHCSLARSSCFASCQWQGPLVPRQGPATLRSGPLNWSAAKPIMIMIVEGLCHSDIILVGYPYNVVTVSLAICQTTYDIIFAILRFRDSRPGE